MKIENQVCTLEQAKRLKELGISQAGYFFINPKGETVEQWMIDVAPPVVCSAYTVGELGIMLPEFNNTVRIFSDYHNAFSFCGYNEKGRIIPLECLEKYASTEAQKRAEMLIYLLETKVITAEEVNQRLLQA